MNIVQIITTIVGYIASIVLFIKSIFDKKKSKDFEAYTTALGDTNTKLQILSKVNEFCTEAEQIVGSGNGPLKSLYVTCKVETLANASGVIITPQEIADAINSSLKSPQAKTSEVETNDN